MVICKLLLYMWLGSLIGQGIGERIQLQGLVVKSAAISIGDTEEQVHLALGEPLLRFEERSGLLFFLSGKRPAQWIYGSTINLESTVIPEYGVLNPLPIRLRIFNGYDDDLIIDWSKEGKVTRIARPEIEVVDGIEKLFEPIFFIDRMHRVLLLEAASPPKPR